MSLNKAKEVSLLPESIYIITCIVYLQDRLERVMSYRKILTSNTVFIELLSIALALPRKHTGNCRIKSYLVFDFRRPNKNRHAHYSAACQE